MVKSFKKKTGLYGNGLSKQGCHITKIKPKSGWHFINFRELYEYRELFFFFVWRDIKVLYAQTILGFSWAVLQPAIQILIFTVVFGKVAKVPTDGIPYILFTCVGIIPWTFMSNAMTTSSQSLVSGQNLLGKIYFPRLIFPSVPVLAKLVDFSLSLVIFIFISIYYSVMPTFRLVFLPLFIIMMMGIAAGVGMWMSALAIRFRDVKHAMPFAIRMLMYTAPIVYSSSSVPDKYIFWYSLNPIVGVIEGFRATLLGNPIPWNIIFPGVGITIILFVGGVLYFNRMERIFVDVI